MPNRTVVGRVTSTNARGFKLDVEGDEWLNWSKFSKMPAEKRPALRRGQELSVELDDKGFVYRVSSANGEALAAAPAGTVSSGSGGRWSTEDAWRATILSSMRSAAQIVSSIVAEDGMVHAPNANIKPSDMTYNIALTLAKRVWAEPVPPPVEKPATGEQG